ncbi:hypothetical protein C4D60_Mb06t22840 [Musa balbisiana]|uniref:Senescence regulator n=1 Tax=Musa balbisiana TaxID=52838 RepID=A0A4S8IQP8_MUSBA|nr:hypothetical protein C4D60_Mb06t22840 [Musa balbisiana]
MGREKGKENRSNRHDKMTSSQNQPKWFTQTTVQQKTPLQRNPLQRSFPADVLWPNNDDDAEPRRKEIGAEKKPEDRESHSWKPVFVYDSSRADVDDDGGGGEMIPPHLIVASRMADKMAFSVCVGNGRTLKGRDLRRVRNTILRLTGFLER